MKTLSIIATALLISASASFAQQGNPGAHFIENWDQDGDGAVTSAEVAEKRVNVFASFDANEDGQLDAEEYALFDEARAMDRQQMGAGHGQGMAKMEQPMERAFNDINGDGMVSNAEFFATSPKMFAQLDRNNDGSVTTDDFGNR